MNEWLVLSLVSMILWGLWGFTGKVAVDSQGWSSAFTIASISAIIVTLGFFAYQRPPIKEISWYAIAAGAIGTLGTLAFYLALERGRASIVVPLTALYPGITILLSFLVLGEKVSFYQGVGILLAMASMVLMSL